MYGMARFGARSLLSPTPMARLTLIALLALALAGVSHSRPSEQNLLDGPVHISESWEYAVCGQSLWG